MLQMATGMQCVLVYTSIHAMHVAGAPAVQCIAINHRVHPKEVQVECVQRLQVAPDLLFCHAALETQLTASPCGGLSDSFPHVVPACCACMLCLHALCAVNTALCCCVLCR
jgi:hypothetical protein